MFENLFTDFLQRATGIVILFAALSWISFKLVELWNIFVNRHGERLRGELAHCFGEDPPGRFTSYFYWHPLIAPLSQPSLWRVRRRSGQAADAEGEADPFAAYPPGHHPGHIAPETFAAVMLDPFPWPSTRESLSRMLIGNLAGDAAPDAMDRLAAALLERRGEVDSHTTWGAFLGSEGDRFHGAFKATKVDVYADGDGPVDTPLERLGQAWRDNRLPPAHLRANIVSLLRAAENDVDHFRAAVARWYREAMDRASGRFQRASMLHVFLVAIPICLALNVNLLTMGEVLLKCLSSCTPAEVETIRQAHPDILRLLPRDAFALYAPAIHTTVGILLSAALTALGAPFWYDLLGRISRRTGRGPAPRREERS